MTSGQVMLSPRKLFTLLLGTTSLLAATAPASATEPLQGTIVAQGSAINTQDPESASIRALLDALQNVATQQPSRLISHSVVDEQGNLAELISLQSQLDIHSLEITNQEKRGNLTRVQVAINLKDTTGACPSPDIGKVLTTDLALSNDGFNNNHIDVNSILIYTETNLHQLANKAAIKAARINPALNVYENAMLATEAQHQADYHLTIGAHWQKNHSQASDQLEQQINELLNIGKGHVLPKLNLVATLSSHHGQQASQAFQLSVVMPVAKSISSQSSSVPKEVLQQLDRWLQTVWQGMQKAINCSPNYVHLSKLLDQPQWRINKGKRLGLKTGQRLLLIPENIRLDTQDGAIKMAPQVFNILHVEANDAILEHYIGQGDLDDGLFKLVVL